MRFSREHGGGVGGTHEPQRRSSIVDTRPVGTGLTSVVVVMAERVVAGARSGSRRNSPRRVPSRCRRTGGRKQGKPHCTPSQLTSAEPAVTSGTPCPSTLRRDMMMILDLFRVCFDDFFCRLGSTDSVPRDRKRVARPSIAATLAHAADCQTEDYRVLTSGRPSGGSRRHRSRCMRSRGHA